MTTRTARRSIILEPKPESAGPAPTPLISALNGVSGGKPLRARAASEREMGPGLSLELNEAEKAMLDAHLSPLTEREREVVFAVCAGGQNTAVAERLYIALPTLRTHLMRINQKLGLRSKSDTIRFVLSRLLEGYRARSGAARTGWEAGAWPLGAGERVGAGLATNGEGMEG